MYVVNIEIRERNGIMYYYLGHSYRRLGRVRKARIYLGRNLSDSELKLKRKSAEVKLSQRLESIRAIRDPYRMIISDEEMAELTGLSASIVIKLSHLSEENWQRFTESFAYDTNAIEGSTVEKREVAKIIQKNEWPDKSKEEIWETLGVAEAVKYIRKTKEHISIALMKELHKIVFKNSKPFAGNLRKSGEEVAVVDGHRRIVHRGAISSTIIPLLKGLLEWYKDNLKNYPPLVLAAIVHNQFENIHPFLDGNGRVGRLLLNNILIKHGFPPVNIEFKNREEYYAALQDYENEGNIKPTLLLLLREYRSLLRRLT